MNFSTIVGNGKTFTGSLVLILAGAASYWGVLPAAIHVDGSPANLITSGLITLGLGAKLQTLINLLQGK